MQHTTVFVLRDIATKDILSVNTESYSLELANSFPEAAEVLPVLITDQDLKGFLNELLSRQTAG